jgi:pimeloyl-ACP methyl ester carboxylesterase
LDRKQAIPAEILDRRRIGENADLLHNGSAQEHGRDVAPEMPSASEIASCQWLPDGELRVYSSEYERTGFQGGLQWYRARTQGLYDAELQLFAGRTIEVPSIFIAGKSDWGTYQRPGNFERMQQSACTRMLGCHLIDGAGHWVQQEQSERVSELLLEFAQQQ